MIDYESIGVTIEAEALASSEWSQSVGEGVSSQSARVCPGYKNVNFHDLVEQMGEAVEEYLNQRGVQGEGGTGHRTSSRIDQ